MPTRMLKRFLTLSCTLIMVDMIIGQRSWAQSSSSSSSGTSSDNAIDDAAGVQLTSLPNVKSVATLDRARSPATLHVHISDEDALGDIPNPEVILRKSLLDTYIHERGEVDKILKKASLFIQMNPQHPYFGRMEQIAIPAIEHLEDHSDNEVLEMIQHLQAHKNSLVKMIQAEQNRVRNAVSDPGLDFFSTALLQPGMSAGALPAVGPATRVRPPKPYDIKYHIPPVLQDDFEFKDYLSEMNRWAWWENRAGGVRYLIGAAALFCSTASTWKFVGTKDASNFGIANTILIFVYGMAEGVTRYFATKRKGFYRKAQNMVDEENLNAGLPIHAQTPSGVAETPGLS